MKALRKFLRRRRAAATGLPVLAGLFLITFFATGIAHAQSEPLRTGEELLASQAPQGRHGGRLVVTLRSEPRTLNPVLAADSSSREVIHRMMADLVHINRASQQTEPGLAKSWSASKDGRRYTLKLRRGLRFSDGEPLTADDVVFTFQVYADEKVHSPQRDLLLIGGKPIVARKADAHTVVFELAQPYAPAERLFDSIAILPRHLLHSAYREGKFAQAWTLATPASQMAGLGPFRLKEYAAGQRIVLERNPFYWKVDREKKRRLPYLDEIVFLIAANEDAQVIRFQAAESDVISRISAKNYAVLARGAGDRFRLVDLGPSLEYHFLFFNLNDLAAKNLPEIERKQAWFREVRFRQAVSAAIDREGIVRLVFEGRATPLGAHVTPGNKLWVNESVGRPSQSVERARQLLRDAGFSWRDGKLVDAKGQAVEFSIVTSSSNAARTQIGTIIQDDLKALGITVNVLPMESRSVLDRIFNTHEYEASLGGLASGDVDPTSEMNVWRLAGATHLWNLGGKQQAAWEGEIDRLMGQQLTTLDYKRRKRLYDRVQQLVAENLPLICLISPNILAGAHSKVGNFQPAILESYTLWNADEIYLHSAAASARR